VLRSAAPGSPVVQELSPVLARARAAVGGSAGPAWQDVRRFLLAAFPAAVYRDRWWWGATALGWSLVATALAVWLARSPAVLSRLGTPEQLRRLAEEDFADYYSANPAGSFAAQVWTNNAWVAAACLLTGVALGLPVLVVLWSNAVNVASAAGVMAAFGRLDVFFGLITPHGLLELTAVFVAAGAGLRLGWTVVDPGPRSRGEALAAEGRRAATLALGLTLVLLVSGAVEAFVTPSGLPTWARVGVGIAVEVAFLAYILVLGRRAIASGETGDLPAGERGDALPVAA
jgi:uncharacterized membrane protein SpoIIM required for sporulation